MRVAGIHEVDGPVEVIELPEPRAVGSRYPSQRLTASPTPPRPSPRPPAGMPAAPSYSPSEPALVVT